MPLFPVPADRGHWTRQQQHTVVSDALADFAKSLMSRVG